MSAPSTDPVRAAAATVLEESAAAAVAALAVGRPQGGRWPAPQPRLPLRLLVHHERWSLDDASEGALLAAHEAETLARGDFEGRRVSWAAMGRDDEDPVPQGAYGWFEHTARKQGRATWGPQGAKVDADLPAQGLRVRGTGEVDADAG